MLGLLADMLAVAVRQGSGGLTRGTSLDNTLRVGSPADVDWVLVDLRAHMLVGGYGHGRVHLWAPDGRLLATGGQTVLMR
jgi:acyl-CoA thioesterase